MESINLLVAHINIENLIWLFAITVDEPEEEEGDGEEVYNRTTTPAQSPYSQPVAGPSRNQSSEHLLYGIDNQGLDTDFNSVFENIQIKTPPSLI